MIDRFRYVNTERERETERKKERERERARPDKGMESRGSTNAQDHKCASASVLASVTRWFRNFLQSVSSVCRLFSFEFEAVL